MATVLNVSAIKQFYSMLIPSLRRPMKFKISTDVQREENLKLPLRTLERPSELRSSIRLFSSSIMLMVAYSYLPQSSDDHMAMAAIKVLKAISTAGMFGKCIFDVFPSRISVYLGFLM